MWLTICSISDECVKDKRHAFLCQLQNLVNKSTNIKVIITSRPNVPVTSGFTEITLDTTNSRDICQYIASNVHDLAVDRNLRPVVEEGIRKSLVNGAGGMFLWVSLILDDLKQTSDTRATAIRMKLNALPNDITGLYSRKLEGIQKEVEDQARTTLQCIVYARRPLTLTELKIAIAVKPNHKSLEDMEDDVQQNLKWFLQTTFGSLLRIGEDGVVNLVHHSAKDFLTSYNIDQNVSEPTPQRSTIDPCLRLGLQSKDASETLIVACLSYLCFDAFDIGPFPCEYLWDIRSEILDMEEKYEFLEYAAKSLPEHARGITSLDESRHLTLLNLFKMVAQSERKMNLAYQIYISATGKNQKFCYTGILQIAATFGICPLLQTLLNSKADVNAESSHYGHALQAAAYRDHKAVVRLLLESGADVNAEGGLYGSALQAAAYWGHEAAVRLLSEAEVS